ncbi:MAG TPA: hypothetical protein VK031_08490 [Tissierellaceae bacterium]|nr:hypothetical protein [Tissierellaceae bacterium]
MNQKAILIGLKNYNKDTDVNKVRLEKIANCKHAVEAPIKALRLSDRYDELNNKICNKCYCPLPTKARQEIEKCECWM